MNPDLANAYRMIGEGFIALSRAMQGNTPASPPVPTMTREAAEVAIRGFHCPNCHGPMIARKARASQEWFAGCLKYPECKGTRNLDGVAANTRPKPRPPVEEPDPLEPDSLDNESPL